MFVFALYKNLGFLIFCFKLVFAMFVLMIRIFEKFDRISLKKSSIIILLMYNFADFIWVDTLRSLISDFSLIDIVFALGLWEGEKFLSSLKLKLTEPNVQVKFYNFYHF